MHLFSTIQKQSKDTIFSLSLPQTVCALCPVRVSLQQYTSMSSVELHSHTLLNIFFFKLVYSFFLLLLYFQIGAFQWFCFIMCIPFYFLKPRLEGSLSISDLAWKGCLSPAARGEQCER